MLFYAVQETQQTEYCTDLLCVGLFNIALCPRLLSCSCGLTISDNYCNMYECVNSFTHLDCGLVNFTKLWTQPYLVLCDQRWVTN